MSLAQKLLHLSRRCSLLLLGISLLATQAQAVPGDLDTSFGINGSQITYVYSGPSPTSVEGRAVAADSCLLAAPVVPAWCWGCSTAMVHPIPVLVAMATVVWTQITHPLEFTTWPFRLTARLW